MSEESLSLRYVRLLVDAVERRGVSRARLLEAAGWDAARLEEVEGRVPAGEFYRMCERAIELSGDAALGLHAMESLKPDSVDLLGQLVAQAAALREGLETVLRFHKLGGDRCRYRILESEREVTLRYDGPGAASPIARRFVTELHVMGAYRMLRYFARQALPLQVSFEHEAPAHRAEYTRVFAGTERFAQPFTGLVFARELMGVGRRYSDDEYHRALCELATSRIARLERSETCSDSVRALLGRYGGRGRITMGAVARALGVSTRSLRRRLAAEGTSFEAVVDDALAQQANRLLTVERRTIQETAHALGYSDVTSFHRAFKRWTGKTPSTLRPERKPA